MSILHGRETERVVFARVLFIANPDERLFEKQHDCAEHSVPLQTSQSQIFLHPFSNFRQRFSEANRPIVFVLVPNFSPTFMIAILFAATCIAAGGLDVSIR